MLNEDVVKKLKNVPSDTNSEIGKVNTNIETAKTELNTKIGNTILLNTTDKTSLVNSVNELVDKQSDIENLKEVENIKCTTNTGEYTIENSKKGYLTNFNVEGKTLVNLWGNNISDFSLWKTTFSDNKINITTEDGVMYHNFFTTNYSMYKPNTLYTVIVNVYKNTLPETSGIYVHSIGEEKSIFGNPTTNCTINGGNIGKFKYSFTTLNDLSNCNIVLRSIINNKTSTTGYEVSLNITILEGDYTNTNIGYFNGIQSVGQGDKIEILSTEINTPNLIKSDYIYTKGKYNSISGEYLDTDDKHYACEEFIAIKENTEYVFYGLNGNRQYYDSNKNFIQGISSPERYFQLTKNSSWRYWVEKTPSNAHFIKVTLHRDNLINGKAILFEGNKFNKKTIPYTLRSLPNGTKDEIVYKNNKYYLIKRCEEHTYTDIGNLNLSHVYDNTLLFMGTLIPQAVVASLDTAYVLCDNLNGKSRNDFNSNDTEGCSTTGGGDIAFRILKSKLSTQDGNGFSEWIKNNPITIIYQLAKPQEIELTTLNLEQYDNQTKFICNSDTVIPNISFESTQNLGSHIEAIRSSIANISHIQSNSRIIDLSNKLLNGWKRTVSDNDGFIISKNGNQVSFHMRITGGIITDSTTLLKLPDGFTPKTFYVFPIFTTHNQLVQGFMYFNFANGYLQITQLGSNEDIYSYGTYFIE